MFGLLAGAAALLATAAVCELSIYQTRHRKPPAYLSLGTSAPATDYSHVLHNSDVVELVRGGGTLAGIKRTIKRRHHAFRIDAQSVAELKLLDMPDDVIATMIDATRLAPAIATDVVPTASGIRIGRHKVGVSHPGQ